MMKPTFYMLQFFAIILVFTAANLLAQQNDRVLLPLDDEDFKCFQTIKCVTDSESLKEKGWAFIFDDSVENYLQELSIAMKGVNVELSATYNKKGELLRATYKRQNLALPAALLSHIAIDEFDGWNMTGNEMIMKNFEENKTNYTVELQNNSSTKLLTFTHSDILDMKYNTNKLTEN